VRSDNYYEPSIGQTNLKISLKEINTDAKSIDEALR
jgi:hypothetical protein